jgi:hypothetical protein
MSLTNNDLDKGILDNINEQLKKRIIDGCSIAAFDDDDYDLILKVKNYYTEMGYNVDLCQQNPPHKKHAMFIYLNKKPEPKKSHEDEKRDLDIRIATRLLIDQLRRLPLLEYVYISHHVHRNIGTETKYEVLKVEHGNSFVRLLVWCKDDIYKALVYEAWVVDQFDNRIEDWHANSLLQLMEEII